MIARSLISRTIRLHTKCTYLTVWKSKIHTVTANTIGTPIDTSSSQYQVNIVFMYSKC